VFNLEEQDKHLHRSLEMKRRLILLSAFGLVFSANAVVARDIGPDEAAKLQSSGVIQPIDKLNAVAVDRHPGSEITDTELDEEYGKHIYQVDLTDKQGINWDIELDAVTGKVLKDHQDR
jgi:uncharacterized membrane protein YkoI